MVMTMKTAYILLMAAATITAGGQAGTMAAQNRLTPESCVEMALGNNARTKGPPTNWTWHARGAKRPSPTTSPR